MSYHGVLVEVPASWPVVDLQSGPHACIRLDREAVYVGDPAAQQDCPAQVVGRAATIWLHGPTPSTGLGPATRSAKVGALSAEVSNDPTGHGRKVLFARQNVQVDASWGSDSGVLDAALATATPTSGAPATTLPTPTSTASPAAYRGGADLTSTALTASSTSTSSAFTGMGFDTCATPALSTMKSWLSSPYRTVGIYLGGSNYGCENGNLSSSWVNTVESMGWGLIPTYVGPQAPCVIQDPQSSYRLVTMTPSQAAAEGTNNADAAATRAASVGLSAGTPIYYDMEAYNTTVAGCSSTVMTFISAWSKELAARGYSPAAYGSPGSLMTDMSKAMGTSGFVPPNDIWFAHWNGLQSSADSSFSSASWTNHQRLHQYSGNITQTWGGTTITIDADWSDAQVAGAPVAVDYGTNVVGPGSAGFTFTGDMGFWRPNAPQGLKGMAYWTYSNGASEYNGATWAPHLAPGLYNVQAYVPATAATAIAPYTVRYAGGTAVKTVSQQLISGYTSLGTYLASGTTSISVHVGDNDGTSTTTQLGVDAMAFQLVASAPSAATGVTATGGNASATVSWGAAAANGSPVTSYTVAASPGGASVTVSGASTSAPFSGLTNGTAYSFTVTATNAVGNGPAGTSNTVTPHAPVVLVHDWNSDAHNDVLARDGAGTLWLYPGNGTGGWLGQTQVGSGWNGMTAIVAACDFAGDGHPDLLARDTAGAFWLYAGNGSGGWLNPKQVGSGWNTMTSIIAPGDFNGDGHPDVLARDSSGALWLYAGNGAGGWLNPKQVGSGWNTMTSIIAPGDFNGDGHPDVLARDSSGTLWLYPGNGTGGWLDRHQVGTGWNGLTLMGPGDFNGDGHADVLARDSSGTLWLYAGNGTGGWLDRQQVGTGWNGMSALS